MDASSPLCLSLRLKDSACATATAGVRHPGRERTRGARRLSCTKFQSPLRCTRKGLPGGVTRRPRQAQRRNEPVYLSRSEYGPLIQAITKEESPRTGDHGCPHERSTGLPRATGERPTCAAPSDEARAAWRSLTHVARQFARGERPCRCLPNPTRRCALGRCE